MKSNEDNKTWIFNILVQNIFLCLKQVYCCLTFVCVYIPYFLVSHARCSYDQFMTNSSEWYQTFTFAEIEGHS